MDQKETKMLRAKAWCFDAGVTVEQVESAWEEAKKDNILVVCNLDSHGYKWWWLPPHLLEQLVERYGKVNTGNRFTYFSGGKWRLRLADTEYSGAAINRFAAYENTGLEPGELEL